MLMTVISFVVGLSISGQTFYTFILENFEKFGALKAIGAKRHELIAMILFQGPSRGATAAGYGRAICGGAGWRLGQRATTGQV
jgi:putative ABC transport system permease protein